MSVGIFSVTAAQSLNRRLERFMPVLVPLGLALGFALPRVFIFFRPFVPWLFSLMTLSGALKLRAGEFGETLRRPLPIALFFVSAHVVMPLAALFAASRVFPSADIVAGFILLFSAPTAVSGFIWVSMFRGDKALGLTLILLDTLLAPLLVPGSISLLMGTRIVMDITGIIVSLCLMVVLPTIAGVAVNEASRGTIPARVCPYLDPVSKICLMLVVAANTAPVAPRVHLADPTVWAVAALCLALSALNFLFAGLAARAAKLSAGTTAALVFSSGLRNLSAASTIAVAFFPEAAALPSLLCSVFHQSLAAIVGKLLAGNTPDTRGEEGRNAPDAGSW